MGSVSSDDPLHGFLSKITRDELGVRNPRPAFRVFRLTGSNVVYGYEEKSSRTRLICKFYGPRFGADRVVRLRWPTRSTRASTRCAATSWSAHRIM